MIEASIAPSASILGSAVWRTLVSTALCHRRVNSRQIGRLKNRHLDTRAACRLLPEAGLSKRRPD
jgi:hypothetical protein